MGISWAMQGLECCRPPPEERDFSAVFQKASQVAAFKRLKGTDGGLLSGRPDGTCSSSRGWLAEEDTNRGKKRRVRKGSWGKLLEGPVLLRVAA